MRPHLAPLMALAASLLAHPMACVNNGTPPGCDDSVLPLYHNLCDLGAAWGVVVEALAAAGLATSFVLLVVLLASVPFVTKAGRRNTLALQTGLLVCTLGLYGLAWAFIIGKNFTVCVARRFLFGVLFAGCFACLTMQGVNNSLQGLRDRVPGGWALSLVALGLMMVEVIINTEWLVITVALNPLNSTEVALPCNTTNQDFVMALAYVMVLLVASAVAAVPALCVRDVRRRREGLFLLLTAVLSAAIWVAWVAMYVHGNQVQGSVAWDEPTLAIALVTNAWVFLILYTIPEICMLTEEDQPCYENEPRPAKGKVFSDLQKQASQNIYVEDIAFTVDKCRAGQFQSPYSDNQRYRSGVYQPTELALISRGLQNVTKTCKT